MQQSARSMYNATFSEKRFQEMLHYIDSDFPGKLDFRIAETPVFLPTGVYKKLISACDSIIGVISAGDFKSKTTNAIPRNFRTPNENNHTSFLSIDFAICEDPEGELTPKLIELQGFPSLFAYQPYLGDLYKQYFNIHPAFSLLPDNKSISEYNQLLKDMLLAGEDPKEVVLLEIYPEKQKTRIDFAITERITGIKTVCLTDIIRRDARIFYRDNGKEIPIKRIYNRLIYDDLQSFPGLDTSFRLTDEIDVTWAGHPNWFYRISKYILPMLKNPYVPEAKFVIDYNGSFPDDLDQFVLKPLFSFAGTGVEINVTKDLLSSLDDPENYILQRKVLYAPVVQSPQGGVKAEIRMLYIWPDNAPVPVFVNALSRLSRGDMIGVRYNKDFTWVGSSACFFEKE